ncbi:MAG TPA: hypothetical protein VMV07_11760 [Streptosporangiaceae bacterium]|nr:hypothetical protein [Streptosporangiaceae bacterium]
MSWPQIRTQWLRAAQHWPASFAGWQFRAPLSGPARFRLPRPPRPGYRLPRLQCPGLRRPGLRRPGPRRPGLGARLRRVQVVRPAALAAALAWLTLGIALFTVYLHMSRTIPVNSDGAANALQAWAMLHGNPLLRGWQLSDVSFYTTELPQYAALEALRGLRPDVVHLAGAMTYTLLVLLTAMLAKGRATGRAGLLRAGLAAGIMASPQEVGGVYVLMLSPDHVGSTIPVLLVWILLDRAPRRWWVPVLAGLLLAWALVADSIVLITGVVPLVAVATVRGYQVAVRRGQGLRAAWFEVLLAVLALAAAEGARLTLRLITSHGGFVVWPVGNQLASFSQLPRNLSLTLQGILLLFGANFLGRNVGYVAFLAAVHLVGIGLVAWAACAAPRRFPGAEIAVQLLVTAALVSLAAYILSTNALDLHSTREFTAVLPFGAALAGRLLAGRLSATRMVPALAVVLTGYLLSLGRDVALPAVPAQGSQLAGWLSARHLSYGLGGYWQANSVTLDTGGAVMIRAVLSAGSVIIRDNWETEPSWYSPARHQANFIVLSPTWPGAQPFPPIANVRATFGQPARIYYVGQYTILVWNKNLLTELPG